MQMFVEIRKNLYPSLPFVLTTVGSYEQQPPVDRKRGFDSHQFLWVRRGSGEFSVGGETFTLSAGEGAFFRKGVPHSYSGADFGTAWCTFLVSDETLEYLGLKDWMRYKIPKHTEAEMDTLFSFARGNTTPLSRSVEGYRFVTELAQAMATRDETPADRVLRFLEHRYGDDLTLDEIAAEAGMDRFAFCRYYTRERGVSVMEDLFRIRIAKAKRLLKYSTDTVESVGRLCGFDSPSYFGKRFREAVGCTPAEYRKRGK